MDLAKRGVGTRRRVDEEEMNPTKARGNGDQFFEI